MSWLIGGGVGLLLGLTAGFLWGSRPRRRRGRQDARPSRRAAAEELLHERKRREEIGNFLRYDGDELPARTVCKTE